MTARRGSQEPADRSTTLGSAETNCGRGNLSGGPTSNTDVRLILLDEFRLECGDVFVRTPRSVQRLVAYLGLFPRQPRALVAGTLWPDVSEERAAGSLRSAVWRLQKL